MIRIKQLKNIRIKTRTWNKHRNRMIANWSYDQLQQFVEYQSVEEGFTFELIYPSPTSRAYHICSWSGSHNGELFWGDATKKTPLAFFSSPIHTILQNQLWKTPMTTTLQTLTGPPPKDWSCIVCNEQGNIWDLITHEGCREQCIFHRMCYPLSISTITGECESCGAYLHEDRVNYVDSDADLYQKRDLDRFFRVTQRVEKKGEPFDEKECNMISRSNSWHGLYRLGSTKDLKVMTRAFSNLDLDSCILPKNVLPSFSLGQ